MPSEKSKQYSKGFRWGKREHKFRKYTLRVTFAGFLILVLYYFVRELFMLVIGIGVILMALLTNLWAGFTHVREKKAMDRLRFPWLKQK